MKPFLQRLKNHFEANFAAGVLLFLPAAAMAGSFQVSPVRVTLSETAPTAAIKIINESQTDELVLQIRSNIWAQRDGEDAFTPSTDLVVTPPIFTIKAGGSQTVRVGLRKVIPGEVQQSFRLFLTEVVPAPKEGTTGLQVTLSVSMPVFIAPKVAVSGLPIWRAKMVGANLELSATNPSNSHVQIIEANLTDEQNKGLAPIAIPPRYILANQTSTWKLPVTQAPKGKLRIVARTDVPSVAIDTIVSMDAPITTP